jgi:hypothetical protein
MLHRLWVVARLVLLACAGLLSFVLVLMWAQQYWLRHRAEELLSDVRALDIGISTYQDAQRLYERWKPWTTPAGTCNPSHCEFDIVLRHSSVVDRTWDRIQLTLFRFRLAPRPSYVHGSVSLLRDKISQKGFTLVVLVDAYRTSKGTYGPYELVSKVDSVRSQADLRHISSQHPQYSIGRPGGCDGPCVMAWAYFTPQADASDVRRLMQFDLSCLTRWLHPCQKEGDILPSAWVQYVAEGGQSALSQ